MKNDRNPGFSGSLLDEARGAGVSRGVSFTPYNPFAFVREEPRLYVPYVDAQKVGVGTRHGDPMVRRHVITDDEIMGFPPQTFRKGEQVRKGDQEMHGTKPASQGPSSNPAGGDLTIPSKFDRPERGLRPVDDDAVLDLRIVIVKNTGGASWPPGQSGNSGSSSAEPPKPPGQEISAPPDLDKPQASVPPEPTTPGPTTPGANTPGQQKPRLMQPEKPEFSGDPRVKTTAKTAGKMLELGKQVGGAAIESTGAGAVGLMTGMAERGIRKPIEAQRHEEMRQDREKMKQYAQQMGAYKQQQRGLAREIQGQAGAAERAKQEQAAQAVKQAQEQAATAAKQGQAIQAAGAGLMASSPVKFQQQAQQQKTPMAMLSPEPPPGATPVTIPKAASAGQGPKAGGGFQPASQAMKMAPSPAFSQAVGATPSGVRPAAPPLPRPAPVMPTAPPPASAAIPPAGGKGPAGLKQMLGQLPSPAYKHPETPLERMMAGPVQAPGKGRGPGPALPASAISQLRMKGLGQGRNFWSQQLTGRQHRGLNKGSWLLRKSDGGSHYEDVQGIYKEKVPEPRHKGHGGLHLERVMDRARKSNSGSNFWKVMLNKD